MVVSMESNDGSFNNLPRRLQLRIAQRFVQHLGNKLSSEIQRAISGNAENMGDIPMIKAVIASLKHWINTHQDHDELATQLAA